jgi:hypothetical protein
MSPAIWRAATARTAILLGLVLSVVLSLTLAWSARAAGAEGEECPNQTVREDQKSVRLPECRGYELVSPALKNEEDVDYPGYSAFPFELPFQAAVSGPAFAMDFLGGVPGSESAGQFVQGVGRGGAPGSNWSTTLLAPNNENGALPTEGPTNYGQIGYYSPSLSCAVQLTRLAQKNPEGGLLLPEGEAPEEYIQNMFVLNTATGDRQLVTNVRPRDPNEVPVLEPGLYFIDGAAPGPGGECEHVLFEEDSQTGAYALPIAPGSSQYAPDRQLYEWTAGSSRTNGQLTLVSVLPDGTPAKDRVIMKHGEENGAFHALSSDGSKVFFTARADEGPSAGTLQVFMHELGGSTIQVSASQTAMPDKGAKFYGAAADGSKVFFVANYGLTTRSSSGKEAPSSCQIAPAGLPAGFGCDLYEYDIASETLTDLSADVEAETGDAKGASVMGVVGMAADGSRVYFSSTGQLIPGEGSSGATNAAAHTANVYAYSSESAANHGLSYVATIREAEAGGGVAGKLANSEPVDTMNAPTLHGNHYEAARVSDSGEYLLLASKLPLTSYDNTDAGKGKERDAEYYEYRYTSGASTLTCVSCNPSGDAPEQLEGPTPFGPLGIFLENTQNVPVRNLLDDGRVFFDGLKLTAEASTTMVHVWEWQPSGYEECSPLSPSFDNGCLHLLDGGESPFPSYFEGASADGEHVYLTTTDPLAKQDPDGLRDVYDVRVGGGSLQPPPEGSCEAEGKECQGPEGGTLNLGKRGSEAEGTGNPPLAPKSGNGEVEAFTTGKVKVKRHAHKGATITLVIAAPGKGTVTVSGANVKTVGKSVGASGTYTIRLTLGAKAKAALEHHKKVKVKLHIAFKPANGNASSAGVTFTV